MLELEGRVQIVAEDGGTIEISASGSRVRAEVGSLRVRRPTLRLLRSSFTLARRLASLLERRRLTLVVTRDGAPLVELGAGVGRSFAARLLRLPRVRIVRRG